LLNLILQIPAYYLKTQKFV